MPVTWSVILALACARALVPACAGGLGAVSRGDDRRAAAPVPASHRRVERHALGGWAGSAAAVRALLRPRSSLNRSVPATRQRDRSAPLLTAPRRTRTSRRSPPRCRSEAPRAGPPKTARRTRQIRRGETPSASSKRNAPRRSHNRFQTTDTTPRGLGYKRQRQPSSSSVARDCRFSIGWTA